MAQNFKISGDVLQLKNGSGATIPSGSPIFVGKFVGIAAGDIANGETGSVLAEGVFELPKTTGTAIAQGDIVTWDAATKKVSKDFAGNDAIIGIAYSEEASGSTTVQVCIDEQPLQAVVVAAITTANGSDAATTQALANATKTTVNAILTALKNAGIMAS
jgi:predicted RecA/RadA family phage recombinase